MRITNTRSLCGLAWALMLGACASQSVEDQGLDEPVTANLAREFEALSMPQKVEFLGELRAAFDRELLTPDPALLVEHGDLATAEGVRVNRVLNRGTFEGLTLERGGGAYFSFTSLTNDYDQGPDLELQQWRFTSGFAGGDWGHVVRLEVGSLQTLTLEDLPAELRADIPPPRARRRPEQVQVGAVFAVRSIRLGESDLLVALEVLQRDDYGVTFAWRPLMEFAVPERG